MNQIVAKCRKRLAAGREAIPVDGGRLQKRIEELNRQIDLGAERVFSAPENLVGTIYAKLENLRQEREPVKAQLNAAREPEATSGRKIDEQVKAAEEALRDFANTLMRADPAHVRELLQAIIVKIKVAFVHEEQKGGRTVNTPTGGRSSCALRRNRLSCSQVQALDRTPRRRARSAWPRQPPRRARRDCGGTLRTPLRNGCRGWPRDSMVEGMRTKHKQLSTVYTIDG